MDQDPALRAALAEIAFHAVNAEEGEGETLSETYDIHGYPSYVLTDASGEEIDRWRGFEDVESFLERLGRARSDLTTVAEKRRRFESDPDAATAATLASVHAGRTQYEDAVRYYREAERLDAGRVYAREIFENEFYGLRDGTFDLEQVRAAADDVLARQGDSPEALMTVALMMASQAREHEDPELFRPYAEVALRASEDAGAGPVADALPRLRIEQALLIDDDPELALALKRETMGDGWQEDAGRLNEFAWWCFENGVALEEAETLARRGADLAESGPERAMILDTVAEICNARGACDEAIEAISRAMQEDPDNEYYRSQEERFRTRAENDCA